MWQIFKHKEIDKAKWDACIDNSINHQVFAESWFLDAVCPGWVALIIEKGGVYEAVFPLCIGKKKGVSYVYQPIFAQQLGVFSPNEQWLVSKSIHACLSEFPKKVKLIETTVNEQNCQILKELPQGWSLQKKVTQLKSLVGQTKDSILSDLDRSRKKDYNRGVKNQLAVLASEDPKEVVSFFKNLKIGVQEIVTEKQFYSFENLLKAGFERKVMYAKKVVSTKGEILAMGVFFENNDRYCFLLGSANEQGRKVGAVTYMLVNEMLDQLGVLSYFDFQGSFIKSISDFNSGFDVEIKEYGFIRKNNLPFFIKWFKK